MPNVVLANPLAQTVTVHLRRGGKLESLRLAGYAKSEPLPQEALAEHAQALIARGLLRVRKAPEAPKPVATPVQKATAKAAKAPEAEAPSTEAKA